MFIQKISKVFRWELGLVAVLTVFFGWLYWHDSTQGTYLLNDYRQGTYYQALALQFEKGLLGSKDLIGGDWLSYHGWYYLYFGPLPALLWLALKHLGINTTFTALTLLFSVINLLCVYSLLSFLAVDLKLNRNRALLFKLLAFVLYALGPLYFISARYFIYETAIVMGSTFLLLAVIVFYRYARGQFKTLPTQGAAVFVTGLLFACVLLTRINLILALFPILAIVVWREWTDEKQDTIGRFLRAQFFIVMLLLPVFIASWGMTLYNTARFGNALEFGIKYSIIGSDHSEVADRVRANKMTGGSYLWRNTVQLAILRPFWTKQNYHISYYNRPSWLIGAYPRLVDDEFMTSLFFSSPLLLLAIYCVFAWKKHKETRFHLLFLSSLAVAAFFYGGLSMAYARRYIQDYYAFLIALFFLGSYYFWQDTVQKWNYTLRLAVILILIFGTITAGAIAVNLNCQVAFTMDFNRCLQLKNRPSSFKPLSFVPVDKKGIS